LGVGFEGGRKKTYTSVVGSNSVTLYIFYPCILALECIISNKLNNEKYVPVYQTGLISNLILLIVT